MAFNPYEPVHHASSYGAAVSSQPGFSPPVQGLRFLGGALRHFERARARRVSGLRRSLARFTRWRPSSKDASKGSVLPSQWTRGG
jgi:hypothetical protein